VPDTFHAEFVEALAGQEHRLEPFLEDATHLARARVYRNNSVTACADAIVKNYPTIEKLVGTDFLRAVCVAFVDSHPPVSPVLALYGDEFPAFLGQFPPAVDIPYLEDVARLDNAWNAALFAENVATLEPADLAGLTEEEVISIAPGLPPSVHILESDWPAWKIWRANRDDEADKNLTLDRGWTGALVWWSASGVTNRELGRGEFLFLQTIAAGGSFGDALAAGAYKAAPDKLFDFFSEALSVGVFAKPNSTPDGSRS